MILSTIAALAPALAGWLFGDKGEEVAEKAIGVAKALTGENDDEPAMIALQNNPELLVKWQEAMNSYALDMEREKTKQLQTVNATMQTEINGSGTFKTGWRPAFGWAMAFSWATTVLCIMWLLGYTVTHQMTDLTKVIQAIGEVISAMVPLWVVAMSVLGVTVWKRSSDKRTAQGDPGSSIGNVIKGMLGK